MASPKQIKNKKLENSSFHSLEIPEFRFSWIHMNRTSVSQTAGSNYSWTTFESPQCSMHCSFVVIQMWTASEGICSFLGSVFLQVLGLYSLLMLMFCVQFLTLLPSLPSFQILIPAIAEISPIALCFIPCSSIFFHSHSNSIFLYYLFSIVLV